MNLFKKIITNTLLYSSLLSPVVSQDLGELEKIVKSIEPSRQRVVNTYNHKHQRNVVESYDLMTDFIVDGWDIGSIEINEKKDFIKVFFDLPFYDSEFLFYAPTKNTYVEVQTSGNQETYYYKKQKEVWKLIEYTSNKPRQEKLDILNKGFESKGETIIEGLYEGLRYGLEDSTTIFLMGNEYVLISNNIKKNILNIGVNWKAKEGEELIQIKDDLQVSTENFNELRIPLAGRIELTFPKLYDLKIPLYGKLK